MHNFPQLQMYIKFPYLMLHNQDNKIIFIQKGHMQSHVYENLLKCQVNVTYFLCRPTRHFL